MHRLGSGSAPVARLASRYDLPRLPRARTRAHGSAPRPAVRRPAGSSGSSAAAAARRVPHDPPRRRTGRRDRGRRHLQLGPLLPVAWRPRRPALRVLDHARRMGRGNRAGRDRRPGHVQQLPQPGSDRRHGAHRRPHQRRAAHPRHRCRLVRKGLRQLRLRVRYGRWAAQRAR